jgi:hypothetical protein
VLQVLQHRRIRQTPGTFAIAPFGRLLRPAVAYGDGYSNPSIPGAHGGLIMGFGGPYSSFGFGRSILKFSTKLWWDGWPNVSKDHLLKCYQVPKGSGIFYHSSLKTSFSAMMTHDDCPVQSSKNIFHQMFFILQNILLKAKRSPKKINVTGFSDDV